MENFYDSEHEKQNKENAKEYKKKYEREISDLQKVLRLPEGRRFIYKVLCECGVFKTSFSQNSMTTAFNEGKRDIGLSVIAQLDTADPGIYSQMLKEYFSEQKSKKPKQEDLNV